MYKQEYLKYKKKYIESKRLYGGNNDIQKTQIKYNKDTCREYTHYINSLPLNFMKYEDYEEYNDKKMSAFLITNNNELCREDFSAINDIIKTPENKNVPIYLEDNSYIYQDDNKKYYWSLVSLAKNYFDNQKFGKFKKSYSIYNKYAYPFKMIYEGTPLLEIVLKVLFLIVEKYYITYEEDFERFYELIKEYNDMNIDNKKEFCELYDNFNEYVCSSFFIFYNEHPDYYLKQSLHKDAISALNEIEEISKSYHKILQALRFNIYYFNKTQMPMFDYF